MLNPLEGLCCWMSTSRRFHCLLLIWLSAFSPTVRVALFLVAHVWFPMYSPFNTVGLGDAYMGYDSLFSV